MRRKGVPLSIFSWSISKSNSPLQASAPPLYVPTIVGLQFPRGEQQFTKIDQMLNSSGPYILIDGFKLTHSATPEKPRNRQREREREKLKKKNTSHREG
mmetsp:Transcript_20118/g.36702  ORF Transcript_20118/g.36702 Transcript_20118/m.36702 type:complete len:99 (+) Transcript_20118:285-581(+)